MKGRTPWAVVVIVMLLAATVLAARLHGKPAEPQEISSRCAIFAPEGWGEYVDSGSYGIVFRDSSGTLRFVNRFPCGLDGAPNVSLEIRRK